MTEMTHDLPKSDRMLEVGHAFRASKTLLTAVELGVFTALADGPLDAEALRKRAGIHERGARDFLDALVALGMLLRDESGHYANSVETDLYLDRNKRTFVGGLLERSSAEQYGLWTSLTTAIRTGMPQCNRSVVSHFASVYGDEVKRDRYVSAMTARTRPVAKALAVAFPWADYGTFIDIGASQGCLPVEVALAHPHITGGGFDLPQLAPLFDAYVKSTRS